jgi:hypothetical protein
MRGARCAARGLGDLAFVDFVARIGRLRVTLAKRRLYKKPPRKSPGCFHPGLVSELAFEKLS